MIRGLLSLGRGRLPGMLAILSPGAGFSRVVPKIELPRQAGWLRRGMVSVPCREFYAR